MAHHARVMVRCLDAVGARSVIEIGAYAGDLTRVLVQWAAQTGGQVAAIDPRRNRRWWRFRPSTGDWN